MPKSKKILIEFSKPLVGDVTGRDDGGYAMEERNASLGKSATASSYYSSYIPDYAFDGNLPSTYWYTRTALPQWIRVDLGEAKPINKMRAYLISSNRPNAYEVQGSNNDTDWTTIYTGNFTNTTGWHEVIFPEPLTAYRYIRLYITSKYSSYIMIYELEFYYTHVIGNERAFTISGQEYNHIDGILQHVNYEVTSVEPHGESDNQIVLNINPYTRLKNPDGNITVSYNQVLGNLKGQSPVESFSQEFLPVDLIKVPNPLIREYISAQPNMTIAFNKINFGEAYAPAEYISATPNMTITLTKVNDDPL